MEPRSVLHKLPRNIRGLSPTNSLIFFPQPPFLLRRLSDRSSVTARERYMAPLMPCLARHLFGLALADDEYAALVLRLPPHLRLSAARLVAGPDDRTPYSGAHGNIDGAGDNTRFNIAALRSALRVFVLVAGSTKLLDRVRGCVCP